MVKGNKYIPHSRSIVFFARADWKSLQVAEMIGKYYSSPSSWRDKIAPFISDRLLVYCHCTKVLCNGKLKSKLICHCVTFQRLTEVSSKLKIKHLSYLKWLLLKYSIESHVPWYICACVLFTLIFSQFLKVLLFQGGKLTFKC